MVRITLPENNTSIVASKYHLYMPSEQQLLDELKSELGKPDPQSIANQSRQAID